MIIKKKNFNIPNASFSNTDKIEEIGDIVIDIPELDFDEVKYAYAREVGRQLHEEEGVFIGHFEITGIKCMCKRIDPLYWNTAYRKQYFYEIDIYVYDGEDYMTKTIEVDDLRFITSIIIPHVNILIDKGYKIADINWDWIDWQCKCWDFGIANHQTGRRLNFYKNDIRSAEDLYDRIENLVFTGCEDGINHVGKDNDFWEVINIELKLGFPFIDRYIAELLFDKPKYNEESKAILYSYETNPHSAYAPVGPFKLDESKLARYKSSYIKTLRIYKLHQFDAKEMMNRRFLRL